MVVGQSPAPQSEASTALVSVNNSLNNVVTLLGSVNPPIQDLVVQVAKIDTNFLTPGINLCNDINYVCNGLRTILDFCSTLSLIPVFGTILGRIVSIIKKIDIDGKLRDILRPVQNALEKLKNEGFGRISISSKRISEGLQKVSDKVQSGQKTLAMMLKVFGLIDLGVFIFFEKGNKDPTIETAFGSLKQMATDVGGKISPVLEPLRSIKSSVEDPIQKFKDAIVRPLQDGLGDFPSKIASFKNTIEPTINALQTILNGLGPFKLILEAGGAIADYVLKYYINAVMMSTKLNEKIDELARQIESALGVEELEKKVKDKLEGPISNLQQPIEDVVNLTQTITSSVEKFETELNDYKQHPVEKLSAIVVKGLKDKYPQLFQQDAIQHRSSRVAARQAAPEFHLTSSVAAEVDTVPEVPIADQDGDDFELISVPERLRLLDDFIRSVDDSSIPEAQALNRTTLSMAPEGQVSALVTEESNSTPNGQMIDQDATDSTTRESGDDEAALDVAQKLDYAIYDGDFVSVLIRVVQDSVLQDQADARSAVLPPMSSMFAVQLAAANTTSPVHRVMARRAVDTVSVTSPSAGKAPKLDEFANKCAALNTTVEKAKAYMSRINAAAKQADQDFGTFATESVEFSKHLIALLDQIDPLFTGATNLLELPLKYRTVLVKDVGQFLHAAGASPAALDFFPALFASLDKADHVVTAVRERLGKIKDQSKTMSDSYTKFFAHAKDICYPEKLFPKSTGTNMTTFIAALQSRLDGAITGLATLVQINKALVEHPEKIADPTTTFTKLNELYAKLLPIIDATFAQAEKLDPLVNTLHGALSEAHKDVQIFFQATKTVSDLCRAAEAQVVSADSFHKLCDRINSSIAPFDSMLAELEVQKDSLTLPEPNLNSAVKTANDVLNGQPMEIFNTFFSASLATALAAVTDQFIGIGDLEAQLKTLSTTLSATTTTTHIDAFAAAITQLGGALDPKTADAAASVSVLLDSAGAKSLGEIITEISTVVATATGGAKSSQ